MAESFMVVIVHITHNINSPAPRTETRGPFASRAAAIDAGNFIRDALRQQQHSINFTVVPSGITDNPGRD